MHLVNAGARCHARSNHHIEHLPNPRRLFYRQIGRLIGIADFAVASAYSMLSIHWIVILEISMGI